MYFMDKDSKLYNLFQQASSPTTGTAPRSQSRLSVCPSTQDICRYVLRKIYSHLADTCQLFLLNVMQLFLLLNFIHNWRRLQFLFDLSLFWFCFCFLVSCFSFKIHVLILILYFIFFVISPPTLTISIPFLCLLLCLDLLPCMIYQKMSLNMQPLSWCWPLLIGSLVVRNT